MDLNHLKNAWDQLKIENNLASIQPEEILHIIEIKEEVMNNIAQRLLTNSFLFIVLTICC
ncbi:MAG: hypothetical protein KTR26_20265 [Flammeovirgaceae bacterium]|nr:hypothetical protein [Flammeovirgaceae bacterium]